MASLAGRNRTVVAALLIALVAAFSLTYPASAKAAVVGPEVGVQWHAVWSSYSDVQRVQVLDSVKASGMQWVRIDVGWDMIETNYRGERNAYWTSRLDDFIGMAVARGLKPMVMLYQTPAWARPSGTASNTPPSDPATFASFAGWAAARWAGRVAAWEIWNEPNLDGFWRGTDPAAYSRLVRLAYPAIKSADPRALVVAGAVSYNDDAFLAKMYAAGARGFFDVLSTHPYMGQADAAPEAGDDGTIWTMRHVKAVRDLMIAQGDGAKPVWFTEFGWSSHLNTGSEAPWQRGVTEQAQADYLVRSLKMVAAEYPYVKAMFWYNERNRTDADTQNNNYGLTRADLTPKPSYNALKTYLTTPLTPPACCTSANLFTSDQASFTTGTGGWLSQSSQSTLRWLSASGSGAVELKRTGTSAVGAPIAMASGARRATVVPLRVYDATINAKGTYARTVSLFLNWFDTSGGFISQSRASARDTTAAYSLIRVSGQAPARAYSASLTVQVESVRGQEAHIFDNASLYPR